MSIVDLTGRHAVTVSGATYNASGGPFNAGYYSLDGVDDFIRFADSHGDFVFGTCDYSVRFYAQVLSNREVADGSDIKVLLDQGVSSGAGSWVITVSQPKQVYGVEWSAPYNSPVGAWIKFEFSRVNGVCTNYVNDVPVYSAISPSKWFSGHWPVPDLLRKSQYRWASYPQSRAGCSFRASCCYPSDNRHHHLHGKG